VALLGVSASEGENTRGNDAEDENPIVHRLDLLSMMEGIGMGTGASRRIIDVGLDWKYMSATAEDKITTPKLLVGAATASDALINVDIGSGSNQAALFTGSDDVVVRLQSTSKKPVLEFMSGSGKWDVSVPDAEAFHIGKSGTKPTIKMADGKLGVATESTPKSSLHIQSNEKGDQLLFQGNYDGKTDGLMDSMVTLESSADNRGRGVFMPHRGKGSAGASTAWFVGVPNQGGGFQIGSSSSHITESTSGPYVKKSARMFVSNDGKVAFGHTNPEAQVDIQYTADISASSNDADRALNIRSGSINVDIGQGLNTGRMGLISGEKDYVRVASATKTHEREIRLQTGEKNYVAISRYNAYVGIGGVTQPQSPLDVKGNVRVSAGQYEQSMEPKAQEQMMVLNSQSTVPAAIGFRQADKPYMSISAGKSGATIEMANNAALTIANGKLGVGTDPSELLHVKGGDALLEGKANLWFNSKVSGTRLYEEDGLHLAGGGSGKIHLDNSDVQVTNNGANSRVDIIAGPTKESMLNLVSGTDTWKLHATMAGTGSLLFSNKGVRAAITKQGRLGVGIETPSEALHVVGSTIMESTDKPVFVSMKAKAETQAAGVLLTSGTEEWRVMSTGAGSTETAAGSLEFAHASKTHVVISKSGSLGVGQGQPQKGTSLHVKGPSMFDVGRGKGKVVISTPNQNPGLSFFDNDGFRSMDLEAHSKGISLSGTRSVGIGTNEPKGKLHIYDAKSTKLVLSRSGQVARTAYISYAGPYMKIGTAAADGVQIEVNNEAKVTVHPTGNIGLHTKKPQSQLQVGSSTHLYQAGDITVLSGNAFFDGAKYKYTTAGGAGAIQISKDGNVGLYAESPGSENMEVAGFATARLMVTAKGFVGIGTEQPVSSLHLASVREATLKSHGMFMIGAGISKPNIVIDDKTIVARDNGQPAHLRLNPFGGDVSIWADSTKPGRIVSFHNAGNVGFGVKTPTAKLQVSEGAGKYTTLGIGESNAGIGVIRYKGSMMTLGFSASATGPTNKEDAITILKEGNVGIGMASPTAKLSVGGDVVIAGKLNVGGKQIVSMMEDLVKENQRLSMELSATKEMMMSMSSNMKRLSEMQQQTSTE